MIGLNEAGGGRGRVVVDEVQVHLIEYRMHVDIVGILGDNNHLVLCESGGCNALLCFCRLTGSKRRAFLVDAACAHVVGGVIARRGRRRRELGAQQADEATGTLSERVALFWRARTRRARDACDAFRIVVA